MALIETNWNPDNRQLRNFGWFGLAGFGLLGTWVYFRNSMFGFGFEEATAQNVAIGLWIAAGACAALALVFPKLLYPLYIVLTVVSIPIGFVLSHVILGIMFFGLFTPIAILFKIIGRDSLRRKFEPDAASYWIRREPVTDVKRYFRQS